MLSRCSTRSASLGKAGSSSRAGPIEATRPSAVTRSPSSKNSKLSGSSPDPGSERKWRIAPRCARTPPALSMWGATLDPGEHFGSLLLGDAGHVAYGHGTHGELLTYLVGACQDALGCIEQYARRAYHDQHQPVFAGAVSDGVVGADHHEQHRQREIGVVRRSQLGGDGAPKIGLAILFFRAHQRSLSRNDDEKHIRHHDRAEHGAEFHVGTAAAEEPAQPPGRCAQEHGEHRPERTAVAAKRRAAQAVVDDPPAG